MGNVIRRGIAVRRSDRGQGNAPQQAISVALEPMGTPPPPPPQPEKKQQIIFSERSCAEALMFGCIERLGAQSPAALMVCDTYLAREFWTRFVHFETASKVWAWDMPFIGGPTKVLGLGDIGVRQAACGHAFSLLLLASGKVLSNSRGVSFDHEPEFSPVPELEDKPCFAVACGQHHGFALLESGDVFGWGSHGDGELGCDAEGYESAPVIVPALSGRRVQMIACGGAFTLAVLLSGEVLSWGRNAFGQLGLGDQRNRRVPTFVSALDGMEVDSVSCGNEHSAAILSDGRAFLWGHNLHLQVGVIGKESVLEPEPFVDEEELAGRPLAAISCGEVHTLALLRDGTLLTWGEGKEGQLGVGLLPYEDRIVHRVRALSGAPICAIGSTSHACYVLLESGELYGWGRTSSTVIRFVPALVEGLEGKHIIAFAASIFYSHMMLALER